MSSSLGGMPRVRRRTLVFVSLLLFTILTVTAALVFDAMNLGAQRPDLYDPGREALVEAQWQLAQAIPHGQSAPIEASKTHQHIRTVLDWLETVQHVQPSHRKRVAELRRQIGELEAADRAAQVNARRRDQIYDRIVGELRTMIAQYQDPPPLSPTGQQVNN